MFFPLEEWLSGPWLWFVEVLPLLHPVRLVRAAFDGAPSIGLLWGLAYVPGVSAALLAYAVRRRWHRLIQ